MSQPKFSAEIARQFLQMLADAGQIHIVAINPNGLQIAGRDYGTDVDKALAKIAETNADGINIYWTVNRVRDGVDKKPKKTDLVAARFVHVDIDPPKTGGAFDKAAIIGGLSEISAPPSFIIDSGGGLNAFWRLDEECENLASIEAINIQVRDYFEADDCWNIDRVMRVPGTINWPDAKKKARGRGPSLACIAVEDDGVVYLPHALSSSFPAANPASTRPQAGPISLPSNVEFLTSDDLGLGAFDPLRLAIDEPPGRDRSGDGVAAARLLANAGHSDAQIMGVLLNPDNPVSAHYLSQRDPKRAAARTLQLVRSDGPAEGEKLYPEHPGMSEEQYQKLLTNLRAKVRQNMVPTELAAMDRDEAPVRPKPEPEVPSGGKPSWLRDLGNNPLALFVEHVCDTAPSPQPWVTLGAAIATFGAIAGRRYAGPTNLRTNIYSIGIADSGGGKDHPLRMATRLMIDAGLAQHVGASKIPSGAGLITAVTRNPSILFPLDEVGFIISSAADRRRAPKHLTEIIDNLTEFYSLADSTFLGSAYANDKERPREVIEQPCLCLFGVTTPAVFWGSLSSGNVLDGSLARMVIFQSENDYPDPRYDLDHKPIPDALISVAKAIDAGATSSPPFPIGEAAAIKPKPYVVSYADEAAAMTARGMRDEQTNLLRQHQGTNVTSIIARLAENAAKIALIRAICANPASPVLAKADLEWGMKVAQASVDALMRAVRERVADTDAEAKLKRLHKIIADAGSAGIEHEMLAKQARFFGSRRQLVEALEFLADGGSVRVAEFERTDGAAQGRKKRVYFDVD